jgi:hypothetical protein
MNPVHLHLDHAHILKPAPNHILVEAIADYAPAYARMAQALHADQPLAPHDEADDDIAHCRLLKYTYGKVNAQGICTSSRDCT